MHPRLLKTLNIGIWLSLLLGLSINLSAADYAIYYDMNDSDLNTLVFGIEDLKKALVNDGHNISVKHVNDFTGSSTNAFIFTLDKKAGDEAYTLNVNKSSKRYECSGGRVGLMYAAFDFCEGVKYGKLDSIKNGTRKPYLEKRGLKLNIPLDARTPSYADFGTAAQENIKEMWSMAFWKAQLDEMARNRYNCYTLWNLHPFPSLVKLKNFPDVALDDVKVMNWDLADKNDGYNTKGIDMVDDDIRNPANLVTVRKMSIDEKIKFWQDVMNYGHDRGIEFHIYTWNVFIWGAEGKNGIVTNEELLEGRDNWTRFRNQSDYAKLVQYFREGTEALFETYPRLAGIGVTAGEGFGDASDKEEEQFLADTYGQGVLAASAKEPERKIVFVHRAHQASDRDIEDNFGNLMDHENILFEYSTKYVNARLYSYAGENQGKKDVSSDSTPPRGGGKWWLNLRNDDIFNFRWGDYDFVQTFMTHINHEEADALAPIRGFHMGPDGYVFGREFADKHPGDVRELEHQKHWLRYMLWGRLGYDPNTPESLFEDTAAKRLGAKDPALLMNTWKVASRIIPAINRYFYKKLDYNYHPEYNARRKPSRGWIDLDDFKVSDDWNDVADELDAHANVVFGALNKLEGKGSTSHYTKTVSDIECFAHLGAFYADYIRASYYLDKGQKSTSNQWAQKAAVHWRNYAIKASGLYTDQILGRVVAMNWEDFYQDLLDDAKLDENQLPEVSILSPAEDPNLPSTLRLPMVVSFPLEVNGQVNDPDGHIKKIELLLDGEVIYMRESSSSTFTATVSKPASTAQDVHILELRAYDDADGVRTTYQYITSEDSGGGNQTLPWLEKFDLADRTEIDDGVTAWETDWTAKDRNKATFSVQNGLFKIEGARVEGTLTSKPIDIKGEDVLVSLDIRGAGNLEDDQDYVELWAIVDDGTPERIGSVWGVQELWTTIKGRVSGESLVLQVRAYCSWSNETYFIDNLQVTPDAETLPWIEDFDLADGTTVDQPGQNSTSSNPTSWTASRSGGLFQVLDKRLLINDDGSVGTFRTAAIDISGDPVDISIDFESDGGVDEGEDYVNLYAIVDGQRRLLYTNWKTDGKETFKETGISGQTLVIEIEAFVSSSREYYYFDNLKVTRSEMQAENLPWVENFELKDGTILDQGATSWSATHERDNGYFAVKDNQLFFDEKGVGVFRTGSIAIAGQSVKVRLDVRGEGDLETSDYVRLTIIYQDGTRELVGEVKGLQDITLVSGSLTGQAIQLEIQAYCSWGGESYWMDNLSVRVE